MTMTLTADQSMLIQKRSVTPKIDRGKSLKIVSIFSQQKDYPINYTQNRSIDLAFAFE